MQKSQPEIIMYGTGLCPYCWRARNLLNKKGVEYTEIRIDTQPELQDEMIQKSKRTSVPQIFIGDTHIGGFDELAALERNNELDGLLQL